MSIAYIGALGESRYTNAHPDSITVTTPILQVCRLLCTISTSVVYIHSRRPAAGFVTSKTATRSHQVSVSGVLSSLDVDEEVAARNGRYVGDVRLQGVAESPAVRGWHIVRVV